jgi:hypothetical protein
MGSTLFGGQKSGTPVETRGGTQALADFYQQILKNGGPGALSSMFGRNASESMVNMLGFDPAQMGLGDAASRLLMDPTDSTAGLFRSMMPFEAQETGRQVAGVRGQFGTMGGRFSRNVGEAEALTRGQVSQGFDTNRYNALLQAGGLQASALTGILGAANAARGQAFNEQMLPMQLMQQFLAPGAPQQTEGILPGLLQLGGTAALMGMMPGMPAAPMAAGAAALNRSPAMAPFNFGYTMPGVGGVPMQMPFTVR